MWELLVLLGIVVFVMGIGVIPVLYRIHGENNPSPWAYKTNMTIVEGITNHAATQTPDIVITPDIPDFNADGSDVEESHHASIPDDEVWANVAKLLVDTIDTDDDEVDLVDDSVDNDDLDSVPVLTQSQYDAIKSQYGERVANIITCTPYQGCLGAQVMIGTFFKENNRLIFDQDWVELTNELEEELNGEVIVVKGNFLADGTFFVQHWDDPVMIEAGYSSWAWPDSQVQ